MNTLVKIFLTYAAISMFSGFVYGFGYSVLVGINNTSTGVFLLLWLGPLGIAGSVGIPIILWKMWKGKLDV